MMYYEIPAVFGALMAVYMLSAVTASPWHAVNSRPAYYSYGFDFAAIYKARKNNQRGKIIRRRGRA